MKRTSWTKVMLVLGLAFGLGGFAIESFVTGQDVKKQGIENVKEETRSISGRVKSFVKNGRGDVDGFELEDGVLVHFPPHLSTQVTQLVATGDRVQVAGRNDTLPKGETVFRAEQIEKGNVKIEIDEPRPPRGPRPPHGPRHEADEPMTASGTIREFQKNRHGDIDGFLLADGTEVKVPPHQGSELQAITKVGDEVKIDGHRHQTPRGDIHLHADRITSTSTGKSFERDEPHHKGPVPPHVEILEELRSLRKLIESQQK